MFKVKNDMFSMKPWNAPGPDVFQPKFYQFYWNTICFNVFLLCEQCFVNWNFLKELTKCFITLIPKIENPEFIDNFWPITLCNVIYKVVTKIIVNRIRPLLKRIVGPSQVSFIFRRQTTDNVIVTQ